MTQLLTEKYRPSKLEDLVFINDEYENKFRSWVQNKFIDSHLLLYGHPGTGKSSSINVLINELGITDFIRLNISDKTSIDDMRKVIEYASVPPMNNQFKLVILEEFERASKQAQSSLKYVTEQYSNWCRFIFTTNDISKIDEAIISRCQTYHFNSLKFNEFVTRIVTILRNENISFANAETIVKYVETYYPDLRACLNSIAGHTINNVLQPLNSNENYSCLYHKHYKYTALAFPAVFLRSVFQSYRNGRRTVQPFRAFYLSGHVGQNVVWHQRRREYL